jgi:hypothetical protein
MSQSIPGPKTLGDSYQLPTSSQDSLNRASTPREIRDAILARGFTGRAWFLPFENAESLAEPAQVTAAKLLTQLPPG